MNSKVLIVAVAVIIVVIAGTAFLMEEGKDDGKGSGGDVSMMLPGSQITYSVEGVDIPTEEITLTIMGSEGNTYYVEYQRGIYSYIDTLPSYDEVMAGLPEGAEIDSLDVNVPGIGDAVGERISWEQEDTTYYIVFLKDWGYIPYSDGETSPDGSFSETMTEAKPVTGEYTPVQPLSERFYSETGGSVTVERVSQSVDGGYLYCIVISDLSSILYVGTESMVPSGESEDGAYTIHGNGIRAVVYCEGTEIQGIEIDGTVYLPEGTSNIGPGIPELKGSADVGDWYTLRTTTTYGGVQSVTDKVYVYMGTEDGVDIVSVYEGSTTVTEPMPDGFLSLIVPTYVQAPKFIKTGSETIGTSFGNIPCDIFEGTVTTLEGTTILKVWLCPDNGVAFRIQTNLGESLIELVGTSMFVDPSEGGVGGNQYADVLRTDLRVGDFYEYRLNTMSFGELSVKEEIVEINGDVLSVRYSEGTVTFVDDSTAEEFLTIIQPIGSGQAADLIGEQTIQTIAGEVDCDLYRIVGDDTNGTAYVSKSSGVMYRFDATEGDLLGTYILVGASLLGSA